MKKNVLKKRMLVLTNEELMSTFGGVLFPTTLDGDWIEDPDNKYPLIKFPIPIGFPINI